MTAALNRSTLRTSRLLDFASEKELVAQTGHQRAEWPLVILKELVDNGLDAAEEAGIAPMISVVVDDSGISVSDNGPGLPADVIPHILDFAVRVSSREAYVSPTRGSQGNALKTIVAMPFVLDGESGQVEIEACSVRHMIEFSVDRIRQEPVITHDTAPVNAKIGTLVKVRWPDCAREILVGVRDRFLQIAAGYAWLNPHATISVDWFGATTTFQPTCTSWAKWNPSDPTSPHWYGVPEFERLIAGYIAQDADLGRARTVRELVAEFRGLSATAKQKLVLESAGVAREPLVRLVNGNGLDHDKTSRLLAMMQGQSKPVKPAMLGVIGRDHFSDRFAAAGCEMESFEYQRVMEITDGIPWIVEAAFAWCPDAPGRQLVTGVNWSAGIVNPFRVLGGEFPFSLDTVLAAQRADHNEPVILALHITRPGAQHTDRGKSAVVVTPAQSAAITDAVRRVTGKWAKQRKREERETAATLNRRHAMSRRRSVSVKEAAWQVMEAAYLKASADGTLPAHARQVMYAARGHIQRTADRPLGKDFDKYFTQTLLPDYMNENDVDWNVVFDARGHFREPHTSGDIPLGTLQVRDYLGRIERHTISEPQFTIWESGFPTLGPKHRFGAVLFIEKEGFLPLFDDVQLAARWDLAIMSTKGMSVTAARELVDAICSDHDIPLLVVHDFDVSGFSIAGTLRGDTRRYRFRNDIKVVDLGLRLDDLDGLETEDVHIPSPAKTRATLRRHGATEEEIQFLMRRRVELNAFPSADLIAWIERKLAENGVAKVVPDDDVLEQAYRRMRRQAAVQARIDEVLAEFDQADTGHVPPDMASRIATMLDERRDLRWDAALRELVERDQGGRL